MALIKCPECNKDISDSAVFCPHCGYVLKEERLIAGNKQSKSLKESMHNLIEKIKDIVSTKNKTTLGKVITILFDCLLIGGILIVLNIIFNKEPGLIIIPLIIGINVFNYYQCYVWENRKQWYFWLCLSLTGLFAIVFILAFIQTLFE